MDGNLSHQTIVKSLELAVGDVVSGKYEVLRVLGRGGMGIVYLGRHLRLGHRVAIKTLLGDAREDREACLRFEREARSAAKLKSRFVAKVTDVETLDDGSPAMVMEFLEGNTLGVELETRGRLPFEEAVDCILQACTALQEAHAAGIVHRDIKPDNLFLAVESNERVLKVLDFGISKVLDGDDRRVTTTGLVLGTPMYMSPEQIRSTKTVDHRSDVWAIGVVLYEALTGRPPFDGESSVAVVAAITADSPRTPHEWEQDIPPSLSDATMKALEKSADARYASIAEFAAAIQPFAGSFEFQTSGKGSARQAARAAAGVSTDASGQVSVGGGVTSTVASQRTERTWSAEASQRGGRPRKGKFGAALLGSALVVGLGVAWRLTQEAPARSAESPSSATASAPVPTTAAVPSPVTTLAEAAGSATAAPPSGSSVGHSAKGHAPRVQPSSRASSPAAPPPAPPPAPAAVPTPRGRPVAGDGQPLNL